MGTVRKGSNHEREAMDIYEAEGYATWRPAKKAIRLPSGKYKTVTQDIMGAFDFIAWKFDEWVTFVQVKSDYSDASKARKKILGLGLPDDGVHAVVMMRRKRKPYEFLCWILADKREQGSWQGDWLRFDKTATHLKEIL